MMYVEVGSAPGKFYRASFGAGRPQAKLLEPDLGVRCQADGRLILKFNLRPPPTAGAQPHALSDRQVGNRLLESLPRPTVHLDHARGIAQAHDTGQRIRIARQGHKVSHQYPSEPRMPNTSTLS